MVLCCFASICTGDRAHLWGGQMQTSPLKECRKQNHHLYLMCVLSLCVHIISASDGKWMEGRTYNTEVKLYLVKLVYEAMLTNFPWIVMSPHWEFWLHDYQGRNILLWRILFFPDTIINSLIMEIATITFILGKPEQVYTTSHLLQTSYSKHLMFRAD